MASTLGDVIERNHCQATAMYLLVLTPAALAQQSDRVGRALAAARQAFVAALGGEARAQADLDNLTDALNADVRDGLAELDRVRGRR